MFFKFKLICVPFSIFSGERLGNIESYLPEADGVKRWLLEFKKNVDGFRGEGFNKRNDLVFC